MNILAIIPARGGSKGIPNKNIKLISGNPLISYSIKAAFKSRFINKIVVSTDDFRIARVSKDYNAEVIIRPKEFAGDISPIIDAVIHVLNCLEAKGYFADLVVLLQPTSPLRNQEDIDKSIELFIKNKETHDSLVSICEYEHSPYWGLKIEDGYLKPQFGADYFKIRRQDLSKLYMPNGSIFIIPKEGLLNFKSFYGKKILPFIMARERSIDIDTIIDFKLAELLINELNDDINTEIGLRRGNSSFIIAEVGVNHNGSLTVAKRLINEAKKAGADAVKFQTFKTESIVTKSAPKAPYQAKFTTEPSQYEMIRKLELSEGEFKEISDYAQKKNIIFLSSPFDFESVDLLNKIGVVAFKLGSGEITNLPLIEYVAAKGKPIILSTGMASISEIDEAVRLIRSKCVDLILMYCVTGYPAKIEDVDLNVIKTLKSTFNLPVGFSDHTPGIEMAISAVTLGAMLLRNISLWIVIWMVPIIKHQLNHMNLDQWLDL